MKPYVYIIQNLERTHWYIGSRSGNRVPANEDKKYWGSSKYLKALIKKTGKENWTKTIISEFDDADIAHEFEQMLLEFMWHLPGRVNKNINGYVDFTDPEVKAAHRAGCQKNAQNPEWIANQKVGAQKRSENPEWIAKIKALAKPFIATCIATGEEFYCESSTCDLVKELKLNQGNVSSCLNGRLRQHKGFTFRYA